MGRAPRTKETLPDFLKWRRVTRPPLVFRGLTGSQRTPGFWGVTLYVCKNGGVIDNRFGWDLEFCMKKRVAKVFIELEKVVRGLANEVKLEGDVYEEDQDEMEEEDVKKKRKF